MKFSNLFQFKVQQNVYMTQSKKEKFGLPISILVTEDEEQNPLNLSEKIEDLKIELKESQKSFTVAEYTKKWAIFEYLIRLDDNGKRKMKASMESAQLVFVEVSHQGKYKKMIQLIDDENIVEQYHTWIRSQGGITTPLKFKEFVENKLLVDSGITKKTISAATATRWLNILSYFFKSQKQGLTEVAPQFRRLHLLTEREEQTLMRKTRENRKDSLEEITEYFNKLNLTQISDNQREENVDDYYDI
ncbi:12899_t:CDS:2 [Funneliformis geosporum]|nr:12899_t:CDS:2 [Funneliformis geosporum]